MSEPTIESLTAELTTLRQTNAELLAKSRTRGERIKEMATKQDELTAKLTASEATVYDMTIGAPLRELSKEASTAPSLWLGEFSRHFKAEHRDGKLTILNAAGEPAKHEDGTAVEASWDSVRKLLVSSKDESLQELRAITIVSKASGGGAGGQGLGNGRFVSEPKPAAPAKEPMPSFGLR
jgi:hypothetical protein